MEAPEEGPSKKPRLLTSFHSAPMSSSDSKVDPEERQDSVEDGSDEEVDEESQCESGGDDGVEDEEDESSVVHGETSSEKEAPPARVVVEGVTVVDGDALECGVCCLPLRPPIFRCEVGHVVCSPCRDKLTPAGRCHVCGVAVGGYRRCHAMEQLVESIRVACPHAAHGCGARPAYYDLDAHRGACQHAPCHCPGDACSFVAPTAALLDHFAAAHNWPCTTKVRSGETFSIRVHGGFNFLQVDHRRRGSTAGQYLVMLNMTLEPQGRAISVLCIHPRFAADCERGSSAMLCELMFFRHYGYDGEGPDLCRSHYQKSEFHVVYSDLSDGLPDPKLCFQFVLPSGVVGLGGDDGDGVGIRIKARITMID